MKRIGDVLKEIESSIRQLDISLMILKALVLLMVAYLFFFVIGIEPYYGFVPVIIYFVSSVFVETRIDKIKKVEMKYEHLNEKLRTARDYREKENPILEELDREIIRDVGEVRLSSFFSFSRLLILIFLLIFSVSLSLYIASKDIRWMDFDIMMQEAMKRFQIEEEIKEEMDFTGGEESIMQVGNERIEVEINPVGIDFDLNEVSDEGEYEFSTSFPREVFIASGAAYESEFTEEQQALIKRYFEKKKR